MNNIVDFDLHGLVGIRLFGANPKDVAAVTRQLGPINSTLHREPDILIRFQDQLDLPQSFYYLGENDSGFTGNAFLVLRGKQKVPARVQIPFDRIGLGCEIICEHGISAVPHLIAIVNLTMLGKGYLPLHASAFSYNGYGCLTTGWAKGGKTEALFAFMDEGATYVGDEWVYLSPGGCEIYGIPEPIRVWQWHLDHLPAYNADINRKTKTRLKALDWTTTVMEHPTLSDGSNGLTNMVNRVRPILKKQQYTHLPPLETFGKDHYSLNAPLDKIYFVLSHNSPEVSIQPIEAEEVSQRMLFSLQFEQRVLEDYYLKFRFAFPHCQNDLLENSARIQQDLLTKALRGKEAYVVLHPYPVPISKMFEAMKPTLLDKKEI